MKEKTNGFYKTNSKGISLIVLVITIIVIIILATAILVSVISNNPIEEANRARYESDRDNMQAVFTNTVGKIMAENQGVVNVTSGQINSETSGVNETTGEVEYAVDNAINEANASGTIVFDKGTNTATTYYTGKQLPIYAAGETKWYIDSDGVMSLEVAGVKYGSGQINVVLVAGVYAEDGTFTPLKTLLDNGDLVDENGTIRGAIECCTSDFYTDIEGKLVLSGDVRPAGYGCMQCTSGGSKNLKEIVLLDASVISFESFANCINLREITIPNSLKTICMFAFTNCNNLTKINYNGSQTEWNNIELQSNWNQGCPEITVHCTDGDIVIQSTL